MNRAGLPFASSREAVKPKSMVRRGLIVTLLSTFVTVTASPCWRFTPFHRLLIRWSSGSVVDARDVRVDGRHAARVIDPPERVDH